MSVALSVGSTASRTAVPACSFIIIVNIPISHMYLVLPFTACSPLPTRYLLLPPDGPSSPPHVTPDWPDSVFISFHFFFFTCLLLRTSVWIPGWIPGEWVLPLYWYYSVLSPPPPPPPSYYACRQPYKEHLPSPAFLHDLLLLSLLPLLQPNLAR